MSQINDINRIEVIGGDLVLAYATGSGYLSWRLVKDELHHFHICPESGACTWERCVDLACSCGVVLDDSIYMQMMLRLLDD